MPKIAVTDQEIMNCFNVMLELRPHLKRGDFLSSIRNMERDGYNLVFIEHNSVVVAVAGYRLSINLFMGRHLYIDDLVSSEEQRSKGYGETLMVWLRSFAKAEGCSCLHLDSGTHRGAAHKFYFKQGLTIASYHFSEKLGDSL